jgi:nucleoside-diphosphate-sugar epimerase
MRVVVVGATGNIGTSVLAALTADPKVSSIAAVARRPAEHGDPKVEWHALDVMRDNLDRVLEGAEAVVCLPWLIQPSRDLETVRATNVDGSRRVFEAAGHAGVEALLYSSSVGAYSPGPKDRAVDESWPTRGIQSSFYSRHKAEVERMLDGFDSQMRVVRMRPALVFKREAAAEIRRLFAGPFLPSPLLRRRLIPVVPKSGRLRFQAVHSLDVGEAFRLAVHAPVRGAFNLAADPVLDGDELGQALGARPVPVHPGLLRSAADLAWRLRLQPSPPGWVDLALGVPIMSTARARDELGWSPRYSSRAALLELLDGLRDDAGAGTPRLAPDAGGRFRGGELRSGVGAREG